MRYLYVFAIGGSGERVMKSLILTLASGVTPNVQNIIPVFVDNDEDSNALKKCIDLIRYYNADPQEDDLMGANTLYTKFSEDPKDWPSFCRTKIAKPIILNKAGGNIGNLGKVIGSIDSKNSLLSGLIEERDLLFTQDDLNMPLTVGFVGNPNIGSVVLNSLSMSDQKFTDILNGVSNQDGVIVLGSLFGGTGAAGFPLIVNRFNEKVGANRPLLGGVALLPYFGLKGEDGAGVIDIKKWDVDSESFDTKARAALMYYDDYMRNMDFCYYVGDSKSKDIYQHYVGGKKQENPTHLVELMAALSIIDFANQDTGNRPTEIVYKSPIWGINDNNGDGNIVSTNFSGIRNSELKKSLVKFKMMHELFSNDNFLKWAIDEKRDYVENIGFNDDMRMSFFDEKKSEQISYSYGFYNIIKVWLEWIKELGRNEAKRQFLLYNEAISNSKSLTDNNIAEMFYSNGKNGIAKTVTRTVLKSTGFLKFEKISVEEVDPAEVAASLQDAYEKILKNNKSILDNIKDVELPTIMLKIISDALDKVIEEKCVPMS